MADTGHEDTGHEDTGHEDTAAPTTARLARHELQTLRRSLAMAPSLPGNQALVLVEELERLLDEREHLRTLMSRIEPRYRETRLLLVELSQALGADER
jgi:hypothetical protein